MESSAITPVLSRVFNVSGMKIANIPIGINDINNEIVKVSTCPNFSTASCPKKLLVVPPSPKHEAVKPTIG